MQQIVILGGGAAGLAAALAAAQSAPAGAVRVTMLDRKPQVRQKLLATGNGRCNLDNTGIAPEQYFTADPAALRPLLAAVDAAAPLEWFAALGLYTRTDEAGRVYPYSNQAADVLALLGRPPCPAGRGGAYRLHRADAEPEPQRLHHPVRGCRGSRPDPAGRCRHLRHGRQCRAAVRHRRLRHPIRRPVRRKAGAAVPLPDRPADSKAQPISGRHPGQGRCHPAGPRPPLHRAVENGEVQFTDYGLSGICIMQLSGHLAPGRGPKRPAVELDLFPMLDETALTALFAARVPLLPGKAPADFWTGLLNPKLGRALWAAAKLPEKPVDTLPDAAWQVLANAAKHWLFEGLTPCGWKQAQTTGGGLSLTEVTPSFQFKGCPGLYFVGETLDCAGSCGGFNLHWAFGSGIAAGRDAVRSLKRPAPKPNKKKR